MVYSGDGTGIGHSGRPDHAYSADRLLRQTILADDHAVIVDNLCPILLSDNYLHPLGS
ncbi:hypothetical protein ES708_06327 [subsurface metagenome]